MTFGFQNSQLLFPSIARVYSILSVQMVVTAASVVAFGMNPSLSGWMRHTGLGNAVPILSLLLSTVCWYVMSIKPDARRKAPLKWQLLALFTLGEATSVGFISSFYKLRSVLSAMGATALAASTVSLYTILQKNPKYDLSQWGAGLSSCGLIFLAYGIIQILQAVGILPAGFLPYSDAIYGATGATLFSFYLAYHTKLIVAGKHTKYQMNEKDYVFGASKFLCRYFFHSSLVMPIVHVYDLFECNFFSYTLFFAFLVALYNDIINMFIYVLRLIGEDRDN